MSEEEPKQVPSSSEAGAAHGPLDSNAQSAAAQGDAAINTSNANGAIETHGKDESAQTETSPLPQEPPVENYKLNMDYVSALESRLEMVESMLRQQKAPTSMEGEFAAMFQRMAQSLSLGSMGTLQTPATPSASFSASKPVDIEKSLPPRASQSTPTPIPERSTSSWQTSYKDPDPYKDPYKDPYSNPFYPPPPLPKDTITPPSAFDRSLPPDGAGFASPPPPPPPPDTKVAVNDKKNVVHRVPTEEWREFKTSNGQSYFDAVILASTEKAESQDPKILETAGTKDSPDAVAPTAVESAARNSLKTTNRIAINSMFLANLTSASTGDTDTLGVMVRPFKFFLKWEKKLGQVIADWSVMCKEVEEDPEETTFKALRDKYTSIERTLDILEQMGSRGTIDVIPPAPDFYKRADIIERIQEARECFTCLTEILDNDLKYIFDAEKEVADGSIEQTSFSKLWHLFKPGDMIVTNTNEKGPLRAFCVLHVTGGRAILNSNPSPLDMPLPPLREDWEDEDGGEKTLAIADKMSPLVIDCFYIDYDGTKFGPMSKKISIPEYKGLRKITDLEAFPIRFSKDKEKMQQQLLERGQTYASLTPRSHMLYKGPALIEKGLREYREEVNSEVVLDQEAGINFLRKKNYISNRGFEFGSGVLANNTPCDKREIFEIVRCSVQGCNRCNDVQDDAKYDVLARTDFFKSTELLNYKTVDELQDEHLLLLPARMYGYALQDRKWHAFDVTIVSDLKSDDNMLSNPRSAFDDLVINPGHKSLIQALVGNHTGQKSTASEGVKDSERLSMDLVRGKGRGLIILLHGVPGVGKTSTAECVAAQLKRPLFPITCGDLGTDARTVEENLENYFTLAQRWGCVLLLDEADVFLASRSNDQIQRNSVVSVFLRILEYYVGVLILTTNRVGSFDEAFRSRIHVSLYYPKLSQKSTTSIWEMNIKRVKNAKDNIEIEEDEIRKFYKKHWHDAQYKKSRRWNGRQIRNAFQTAIALANWEYERQLADESVDPKPACSVLLAKYFENVAETSDDFDDYIHSLHSDEGIEDHQDAWAFKAKNEGLRDDARTGLDYQSHRHRKSDSGYGNGDRRGSRYRQDDRREYGRYRDDDHYSNDRRDRGNRNQERQRSSSRERHYSGGDYRSDSNGRRNYSSRHDERSRSRSKGRYNSGGDRLSGSDARRNDAKGHSERPRSRTDNKSFAGSDDEQREQKRRDDMRR